MPLTCPFFHAANLMTGEKSVSPTIYDNCFEEKCALWMSHTKECGIRFIGRATSSLFEISSKMK